MKLKTLFFILSLVGIKTHAQVTKNFIDQNYIEVVGTAEMEVIPDEIYMTILVKETDKPKRTVEEAEKILAELLKGMGIEIKTNLTVLDFLSTSKASFLNHDVVTSKKYQLLLHDAKTVASVFNTLEAHGFTNMTITRLDHSRIAEFKKEVKLKAIKAAQEKAKGLMNAIGQDIGKALYVEETNPLALPSNRAYAANAVLRGSADYEWDKSADITFDKLNLQSSILVRFEIK